MNFKKYSNYKAIVSFVKVRELKCYKKILERCRCVLLLDHKNCKTKMGYHSLDMIDQEIEKMDKKIESSRFSNKNLCSMILQKESLKERLKMEKDRKLLINFILTVIGDFLRKRSALQV